MTQDLASSHLNKPVLVVETNSYPKMREKVPATSTEKIQALLQPDLTVPP